MRAGIGTSLVLIGMGIVLKLAWMISAKSSRSASRAHFTLVMSNVGLNIAVVSALAARPRLIKAGGICLLVADLAAQL